MKKLTASCRTTNGFTLTEVLIVIAIIALLAALIFPVISRAKASAHKVTCLSNVRQVGLGTQLYSNDFDNVYPPYFDHVEGNRCMHTVKYSGSSKYWTELVSRYIQTIRQRDVVGEGTQARLEDLPSVYFCPDSSRNPTQPQNYKPGNLSAFGINDHIVDWWTPDQCGGFNPHAESEINSPSSCALLIETFDWFSPKHDRPGAALALSPLESIYGHVNGAVATVDGRHAQTFTKSSVKQAADPNALNNVFYCDGHVRSTRVSDLEHNATLWSIGGNGQWP